MKLNFDKVEVFTDLAKENSVEQNIRQDFANFIYTQGTGISAHALALKIYNGDADTEYNPQEVEMIMAYAKGCTPCVIDAITELVAKSGGIPMVTEKHS